jgi:hypothetical protein
MERIKYVSTLVSINIYVLVLTNLRVTVSPYECGKTQKQQRSL